MISNFPVFLYSMDMKMFNVGLSGTDIGTGLSSTDIGTVIKYFGQSFI